MRKIPISDAYIRKISSQLATELEQIKSQDTGIRREAINKVWEIIAPHMLIDGYGQTEDLVRLSESPFPENAVKPLIELLKDNETKDKSLILEMLFDLGRYEDANYLVSVEIRDNYIRWARHLRDLIGQEMAVFENLLNHEESEVRVMADDLIKLLLSFE